MLEIIRDNPQTVRLKGRLDATQSEMAFAEFDTLSGTVTVHFDQLEYLESSIGRAGMMAIDPIQRWSSKELWQLNMLSEG